jgi:hypothetical protein
MANMLPRFLAIDQSIRLKQSGCSNLRSCNPCSDLGERNISVRRNIIGERGKSAVVRDSKLVDRNKLGCIDDEVGDFFHGFHSWAVYVDNTHEYYLLGLQMVTNASKDTIRVVLALQLHEELMSLQLKQSWNQACVVNIG